VKGRAREGLVLEGVENREDAEPEVHRRRWFPDSRYFAKVVIGVS
jgi:hypothetical protein